PWLVPFALTPLFLIHRSLSVPALQAEARVDPKTGLFNARYFAGALVEELARAARFERPLSLIMADLDLLRDINNSYGHLAGDAVLKGIAEVFRGQLRHYDVPARFGGEEVALLLPEKRSAPLVAVPDDGDHMMPLPTAGEVHHDADRRHPRPHAVHGPRFLSLSKSLAAVVGLVSIVGIAAGILGAIFGSNTD